MNIYRLTALIVALVVFVHVFGAQEAMTEFMNRLFDIPEFTSFGSNEPIFKLVVRAVYLITLVGIIKLLVKRNITK